MTGDETALLAAARIEEAWSLVETFSTMRRVTPEEANLAGETIGARLDALGVPFTMHRPRLWLATPHGATVQAGGRAIFAKPAQLAASVPEGIEAPLAFVPDPVAPPAGFGPASAALFGAGYDPAPGTPDLRGRIALFRGNILAERILAFQALGAVGVIAVNPGEDVHWGSGGAGWGTPDLDDLPQRPRIPGAAVNRADGEGLIALAASGGSARLATDISEGWFEARLPVVEIPGSEEPERFVLLHGHYDSWDVGVGDNATGDAALLEIARVLWSRRGGLRRSVRIAWWPGHSTGKFAGSTWYADRFALDLARHCVAHMNCDSPGCRWATDYHGIPWMAENAAFVRGVVRDATGREASGKRPTQSSDFSFNNIGITGCFSSSSRIPKAEVERLGYYFVMGNGGNIEWHTDRDRLEVADPEVLLRDIRLYLLAAYRFAQAEVIPCDWRALLAEFRATTGDYQAQAGDRFDLAPILAAIDALDEALGRLDDALQSRRLTPAAANRARLAAMRRLVPLNYTRGTRFRHDPGMPIPPLPMLAVAAALHRYPDDVLGFALVQLERGRNHVLAALEETRLAVTDCLAAA